MRLTLSTLRCPDSVAPETRSIGGGEFSIGRAPDNTWVLPDPEKHLSKRHCMIAFLKGAWQIADLSTNGTWLNRDAEPIGQGQSRELVDGDRVRFGAYEIEVRVERAPQIEGAFGPAPVGAANPFENDPFEPRERSTHAAPQPSFPEPAWGRETPRLPDDFDPLAPDPEPFPDPFHGPSIADHSPAVGDAFRPPAAIAGPQAAGLLPDDWDLDEPSTPPRPPPHEPGTTSQPIALDRGGPRPFEPDSFGADVPSRAPWTDSADLPNHPISPPMPPALAPDPAADPITGRPEGACDATTEARHDALLAAFLGGARMGGSRPADPEATMRELGAAFRAFVSGLRAVLIARAAIKGEFRIEQTVIRARRNNPLKFSADDEDALAALLGTGRRTGMTPAEAVTEALNDLRLHELASVAAMQKAVRETLAQLAPERIQAEAGEGGLLAMQRKARAFDTFESRHEALVRALTDDFDSAFGKAFARAYEEAMRGASAEPQP